MNWTPPDTRFAVTIDEIVEHAVGWICDHEEFDAISGLQDEVENAMDDLAAAKAERRGSEKVRQLEDNLKALTKVLNMATNVNIALRHELDTLRRDGNSTLEIVHTDKDVANPRFTKYSVYAWLRAKFNLIIPEWAPPHPPSESDDESLNIDPTDERKPRKLREDSENNYQRVIEGLVALILRAEPRNKYLESDGSINQSKLAGEIIEILTPHPRKEEVPEKRTIQRKLKDSGVGQLKPPRDDR